MLAELFSQNEATTTVSSGGTTAPASGTVETWTVASTSPFPTAVSGTSQFHVGDPALPTEIIAVTNTSGTTWTVTRGAESSTPVAHPGGFTIEQVFTTGWAATLLQSGNNLSDVGSAPASRLNLLAAQLLVSTALKTGAYNAASGDFVLVSTASGAVTVTLPTAPPDKTAIGAKLVLQTGTNAVTLQAGSGDTFDESGSATASLKLLNQGGVWQYDAALSIWVKIAGDLGLSSLDGRYVQGTTPAASVIFKPANPTPTTSTAQVMMGLGAAGGGQSCLYTPTGSGKVLIRLTGWLQQATAAASNTIGGRYGLVTGGVPAYNATLTGTRFGPIADPTPRPASVGSEVQFVIEDLLALTAGLQYWFDPALATGNASDALSLVNVTCYLEEKAV